MSTPKPRATPTEWDYSAEPTLQRTPSSSTSSRRANSTGKLRAVDSSFQTTTLPLQPAPARHNDTIVVSSPYAFQAKAAVELAALLDSHATIVNPVPVPTVPGESPVAEPLVEESGFRFKRKLPQLDAMKLNKLVVSSYKVMGFAILGTILLGLASFIATNLFYMFNESWVTPMQLSSTDPRVLQLSAQYSAAKAARDGIASQQLELGSRLSDAQRILTSEERFQSAFDEAMKADLEDRQGELGAFRQLIRSLHRTRREVSAANAAYTNLSKDELKKEYAAGLIDKDMQVKGGYELAEIQGANLGLHEKNVEIDARVTDLQRQVASLETAGAHGSGATSYEVLHMRHEYEQSVLASKKASDDAEALGKSIAMFAKTLGDYDTQLARIEKAPYVQAADKSVSTAFVPYDNIGAVKVGDNVYTCAVSFLFCRKAGRVAEVLDGEVIGKHPLHNRDMRGILVRLQLDNARAIEKPVLHLHSAPLGI